MLAALESGADPNVAFSKDNIFDIFNKPELGKLLLQHSGDRLTEIPYLESHIYYMCFEHKGKSDLLESLMKKGLVKFNKIMMFRMIESLKLVLHKDYFRKILISNMNNIKIDDKFISPVINILDEDFQTGISQNIKQYFDEFLNSIKRVDTNKVYSSLLYTSKNEYSQKFKNHILNLVKNPIIKLTKNNTNFNFVEEINNPSIINYLKKQPQFIKWYLHPRQEAIKYNKRYGIFLHSFAGWGAIHNLSSLKYLYEKGKDIEICVSTLDSRTTFDDEILLVGAGNIRLLFDFDCYSFIEEVNNKRYPTSGGHAYKNLEIDDLKLKKPERIKKGLGLKEIGDDYYDEGFIKPQDTNWLLISGRIVDRNFERKSKTLLDILNGYDLKYLPSDILNFALKAGKIDKLKEYIDFKERRLVASENDDEFEAITDEIKEFVKLLKQ